MRTFLKIFSKENTVIVNCQLSIVNSVHFSSNDFDED